MPRQPRTYIGHIYQPRERRPYGHRVTSHDLLEEQPWYVSVVFANKPAPPDMPMSPGAPGGARRVAVHMPRGGVRWVLECPHCGRHVDRLYYRPDQRDWWTWRAGLCRTCWGFRYASQYTGRRPEASQERTADLRRVARRTHDAERRQRRLERVHQVETIRLVRAVRHDRRASCALNLGVLPAMLRFDARIQRAWVEVLDAALREPEDQRAALAAHPSTPAWVAEALQASLPTPASRPALANAPATSEEATSVSEATLECLRTQYRAETQHRERRKAA
jgi:hypothetical protein